MTDLAVFLQRKRAGQYRRDVDAAEAMAEAPPVAEAVAPAIPPTAAAVARIEAMLGAARTELAEAECALAEASFLAITTPPGEERDADTLAEARRIREQKFESVQAIQAALTVARDKQVQADAQHAAAAHAAKVAEVTAILAERNDAAEALAARIADVAAAFRDMLSINTRALQAYPGRPPAGALLEAGPFVAAVANELYRVSADPFVGGGKGGSLPAFPGSHATDLRLVGIPQSIPPLADTIAAANAYVVEKLQQVVAPSASVVQLIRPQPVAPVTIAPTVAPSMPTHTAAEVQASIGKVDLTCFLAGPVAAPEVAPAAEVIPEVAPAAEDVPTVSEVQE